MDQSNQRKDPPKVDKERIYSALDAVYFSNNPAEQKILKRFAKLVSRASLFVDIGASLGQYTRAASLAMRRGRIISVEADPIRFEKLKENCKEWTAKTRIQIEAVHAAITPEDGPVTFHITNSEVSGGLAQHGLENLSTETRAHVNWQEITVKGLTLESLLQGQIPDVVKVDIEGGEYGLFEGCPGILAKKKVRFLVELHPFNLKDGMDIPTATRALLQKAGYIERSFKGNSLFVPNTFINRALRMAGPLKHKFLVALGIRKRSQ